ncbi:MAG: hypothetical protein K0B11_03535 [Mariniphaga sp.]|nr:hypothetical protein [Mariniphaga sp.]
MGRNTYRKQNKEALKNNVIFGKSEMQQRLTRQFEKPVEIRINNAKVKISEVFSEMIDPLMENAESFKERQNIVGMGVVAWNLGIIKEKKGEEAMLESLGIYKMTVPYELKELILEYVEIKCTEYAQYDQFIVDYKLTRISDKAVNITVAYKSFKG